MKASDLFVRALENEGVEFVFGVPGEENLDLLESLRTSSIKPILTRHEQGAGFMAATYGRLTGKAGVCLSTLGPGATNLVTPAAYAQLGGMPMLMVTGQKPIRRSKQGHFQIINVVDMMQSLTKSAMQIVSADRVPSSVRESFRMAEEERPGAVHLEFPEDVASDSTDVGVMEPSLKRRPIVEEKAIRRAVELIQAAKRPLILVGAGANRKLTARMLKMFIDETGIPFFTTQMGKGVIDERDPLYLGCAALSSGDFPHRAIESADLILNIGHDVIEKPPFFMEPTDDRKVIHINFITAAVDAVYFPQVELTGDIANSLWQLCQHVEKQSTWESESFLEVREKSRAFDAELAAEACLPLKPARLVAEVREATPDDGIVTLDNGMYKIWFARNYPAYQQNTLLLDNALATMGAGLPSAIAAKLVYPERVVISVCGDGGFMMNSQELETAVRLEVSLIVLILRDDSYGMIRWKQRDAGFQDYGLQFQNPDFVLYAESYGAHGHRVSKAGELDTLIKKCIEQGGVHVIETPIDYSEDHDIFNHRIPAATGTGEVGEIGD